MGRKSLDELLSEETEAKDDLRMKSPDEEVAEEKGEEPEPVKEPEPEPPSGNDAQKGLEAGIAAERKKRQEIEAQLEQLRREMEASQRPKEEPKDIWEDTQGWQQQFGGQVVSAAVQQATFEAKLNQSEFYARKNIEGFDESWEDLNKWLMENPSIAQQAQADIDPWGFAYRQFNNQRQLAEIGDVEAYKQKMRDEIMAELQAQQPAQPVIPPSLSNQRSVGSRTGPAWSGPPALSDLLK